MIRNTIFTLIIAFLAVYSIRDWYKSLCGLIIIMAVISHPDMRGSLAGIQGFNRWNVLFLFVFMGWLFHKNHENLNWDMPKHINVLLLLFLSVIVIGFFRMIMDQGKITEYTIMMGGIPRSNVTFISEYLINTMKWIIPGLLLFHGCNCRRRFVLGICSLLAVYFLLGIQVIKWMPLDSISDGDSLSYRSNKILMNEIGYGRVNLSTLLAGGSWAIFSIFALVKNQSGMLLIGFSGMCVIFAQALTGGRAGYIAWMATGLLLAVLRWRKILLFIPVFFIIVIITVPAVWDRLTTGIIENINVESYTSTDEKAIDEKQFTAGRNIAWPYEIKAIAESPWIGYGRMSMQRTGLSAYLLRKYYEEFPHPHQAYLEWLMDNGIFGFLPVLILFFIVIKYSASLFRDKRSPVFGTIGGVTLSIVCAFLVASLASQTFYPREGAVPMWCAMGLMFRVYVERSRLETKYKGNLQENMDELLWKQVVQKDLK